MSLLLYYWISAAGSVQHNGRTHERDDKERMSLQHGAETVYLRCGSVLFRQEGGSEKRLDGQQPSIDSSGSNDKGSDPGSGSDTDSTDGGTSNGNSGQSQAPEDKQVVPLLFRNVLFSVLFLSSGT